MPVFNITWESWERGQVEIEASDQHEAEEIFNNEHVGCLEADSEGLDIVEIEDMVDSDDDDEDEVC